MFKEKNDYANKSNKSNKVYEHIKKDLELRTKRNVRRTDKAQQVRSFALYNIFKISSFQSYFVDNARNTAVGIGDGNLKADVKDKKENNP